MHNYDGIKIEYINKTALERKIFIFPVFSITAALIVDVAASELNNNTEDPAHDGSNRYMYCNNCPVRYVDPIGTDGLLKLGTSEADVFSPAEPKKEGRHPFC